MACEITKGLSGSTTRVLFRLEPGQPHTSYWDFSDCGTSIHNLTLFVTKPRDKNGGLHVLKFDGLASLKVIDPSGSYRMVYASSNLVFYVGEATNARMEMNMSLSTPAKPLDCEASFSCVMGG